MKAEENTGIDKEEFIVIRALHRRGYAYAQIGRLMGRGWRTVKRYLKGSAQPVYHREKESPQNSTPSKSSRHLLPSAFMNYAR